MSAITSLATRCLWLDHGQVRDVGSPDKVVSSYLASGMIGEEHGYSDLSAEQYRVDVEKWGYADARLFPLGRLRPGDVVEEARAARRRRG